MSTDSNIEWKASDTFRSGNTVKKGFAAPDISIHPNVPIHFLMYQAVHLPALFGSLRLF